MSYTSPHCAALNLALYYIASCVTTNNYYYINFTLNYVSSKCILQNRWPIDKTILFIHKFLGARPYF